MNFIHYIPIFTTLLSAIFFCVLLRHYFLRNRKPHIAWWAFGVFAYGLGTCLEGSITLFGNSIALTKAWYIAGAILGGLPLAQGSVYLHLKRRTTDILSVIVLIAIIVVSTLVILSPVIPENLLSYKPSGNILGWQWVRLFTPILNTYAAIFLIGGAIYSSINYFRKKDFKYRAYGNALIATGALLPGIGGAMAKSGIVEGLYIGEFIGIILIWWGYRMCIRQPV